jgi:hypothetical protein
MNFTGTETTWSMILRFQTTKGGIVMKCNRKRGFVLFLMLILVLTMSAAPISSAAKNQDEKPEAEIKAGQWVKMEAVEMKKALKEANRSGYTPEELSALEVVTQNLKKADPKIKVLPVENILVKGKHLGLDTPPVIKDGRVLVPVKALAQAFGAEVAWDPDLRTITIVKGEITLVLTLESKTVTVNGEPVELDVSAKSMNGRTVVPLRFIAEQMGLKVSWDSELEMVEIEAPEETSASYQEQADDEDGAE